jgi:hypothetical protein
VFAAAMAAWLAISEAQAMKAAAASETCFRTALRQVMEGPRGELILLTICRIVSEIRTNWCVDGVQWCWMEEMLSDICTHVS